MCLVLFALDAHPRYRLLVAANRDEHFARPTAPAGHAPGQLLPTIAGTVPPLGARGEGCLFASRCPQADTRCSTAAPLAALAGNPRELAACWYAHAT